MEVRMAFKDAVAEMHDLIAGMIESVDSLYTGFIYNNLKAIEEAGEALRRVEERTVPLTEELVAEGKENPAAVIYVSVPSHIQRIGDNLGRVSQRLKDKVGGDVLFSDRAMTEMEYLFERTRDILMNTKDMVLARNTLAAKHIEASHTALESTANVYATQHEERLIEGLCLPRASSLYLNMLDAFKGIAWQAREIAEDLA